jgi:hypothetical protein
MNNQGGAVKEEYRPLVAGIVRNVGQPHPAALQYLLEASVETQTRFI